MSLTEEEMLSKLDTCFVNVFKKLVDYTINQDKQIIVPLSGGLDSRVVVAMLKRLGVENVICYTYGNPNDKEVKISKEVAEALGYKWYFVEYTREKWYHEYHSKDMRLYFQYAGNLTSLPHIQDYLALKVLKEEGVLPCNALFVPGHSGDMLAGSHIPRDYMDNSSKYTRETFLKDSLKKHYSIWKWNDQKLENIFEKKLQDSVGEIDIYDNESCASAVEFFDYNERQSKFIVNSVRAYEFFGYEWRLPLWDLELMQFFMSVQIYLRIDQLLYIKYAVNKLFTGKFSFLSLVDCTTKLKDDTKDVKNKMIKSCILYRGPIFLYSVIRNTFVPITFIDYKTHVLIISKYPLLKKTISIFNYRLKFPYGNNVCTLSYIISLLIV